MKLGARSLVHYVGLCHHAIIFTRAQIGGLKTGALPPAWDPTRNTHLVTSPSKSLYGSPVPSDKVLQNLVSADLNSLLSLCTPHPSSHASQFHWRRGLPPNTGLV